MAGRAEPMTDAVLAAALKRRATAVYLRTALAVAATLALIFFLRHHHGL